MSNYFVCRKKEKAAQHFSNAMNSKVQNAINFNMFLVRQRKKE